MFKILTIRWPHYAYVTAADEVFIQRIVEYFAVSLLSRLYLYESMLFLIGNIYFLFQTEPLHSIMQE